MQRKGAVLLVIVVFCVLAGYVTVSMYRHSVTYQQRRFYLINELDSINKLATKLEEDSLKVDRELRHLNHLARQLLESFVQKAGGTVDLALPTKCGNCTGVVSTNATAAPARRT